MSAKLFELRSRLPKISLVRPHIIISGSSGDLKANLILPLFRRPQFGKTSAANGRGGDCVHEAGGHTSFANAT